VDDLYAIPVLCRAVRAKHLEDLVVVSPDAGFAKKARLYATALRCSLVIADKERVKHDEKAEVLEIIGAVTGKTALVVDDVTISAGTLCEVAE
jgi:ribose-phosphate pyrophosphokinase